MLLVFFLAFVCASKKVENWQCCPRSKFGESIAHSRSVVDLSCK